MAFRYAFTTFEMKTVVVKMMPLMGVMTRGLFRGVWPLWQETFWCTGVVLLVHSTLVVNGAIVPSFLIHSSLVAVVGGIQIVSAVDDPSEPDPASTIHPSPGSLLLSPLSATSNASPHPVLHCRSPPVARVPAHSIHQRRRGGAR